MWTQWKCDSLDLPTIRMGYMSSVLDKIIRYYMTLDAELQKEITRRSSPLDDLIYMHMVLRANSVVDLIEIGTFKGLSALFIAPAVKGKVYTINISSSEINIAKKITGDFGINNVEFINGDSLEVLDSLPSKVGNTLGAVYIDGNHSYKYAAGEYNRVEKYLDGKPKSAAFFDDAHYLHPDGKDDGGVPRILKELGIVPIGALGQRIAVKTFGTFNQIFI
jgi:hypothetical protein